MPKLTNIATESPDQVVVLLGASNLTLAWPRIMSMLNSRFSGKTHVYTAHGMGRSYLFAQSAFGFRKLPGIFRCGIWDALPAAPPTRRTYALITDLGNDLLYGSSAIQVAESAAESIERLRHWSADCKIVMTGPPVEPVHQLGRFRFLLARMALFPLTRLTLAKAKAETTQLNTLLTQIAEQYSVTLTRPAPHWYGFDPIHIKRRYQQIAFAEFLQSWFEQNEELDSNPPLPRTLRTRPRAQLRWIFGKQKHTSQPVVSANGISVFSY